MKAEKKFDGCPSQDITWLPNADNKGLFSIFELFGPYEGRPTEGLEIGKIPFVECAGHQNEENVAQIPLRQNLGLYRQIEGQKGIKKGQKRSF